MLGFWSNKNGQALITSTDLQHLRDDFCLRNAAGSEFNPTTNAGQVVPPRSNSNEHGQYAVSAAHRDVSERCSWFVNGNALVLGGSNPSGCSVPVNVNGFITVNALIADAAAELCTSGVVLSGNPERACQEFKKTTLDKANNNLNFVQGPGVCPIPTVFTYTGESAPACP